MIGWIILGLLAGALARLFTPGRGPAGCLVTVFLGIGGALLAGFVGRQLGFYEEGDRAGLVMATLGAVAILVAYRWLAGRNGRF